MGGLGFVRLLFPARERMTLCSSSGTRSVSERLTRRTGGVRVLRSVSLRLVPLRVLTFSSNARPCGRPRKWRADVSARGAEQSALQIVRIAAGNAVSFEVIVFFGGGGWAFFQSYKSHVGAPLCFWFSALLRLQLDEIRG